MRKSIVSPAVAPAVLTEELWRQLDRIARVELTSEDEAFPIEHALGKPYTSGWKASSTGKQLIRLHFDEPLSIRRIQLHFSDTVSERSQEFAIFVTDSEGVLREIARQQWNFSPTGNTDEIEDYTLTLSGVTVLELQIDPDRSHDPAQSQSYASLASLKIA